VKVIVHVFLDYFSVVLVKFEVALVGGEFVKCIEFFWIQESNGYNVLFRVENISGCPFFFFFFKVDCKNFKSIVLVRSDGSNGDKPCIECISKEVN
jgi:hypothetical protein